MTARTNPRGRCRCCGRYRPTRQAMRWGNHVRLASGRWRKGSWRDAAICQECALAVLNDTLADQHEIAMWGIRSLQVAWGS